MQCHKGLLIMASLAFIAFGAIFSNVCASDAPQTAPLDFTPTPAVDSQLVSINSWIGSEILIVQDHFTWGMNISGAVGACQQLNVTCDLITSASMSSSDLSLYKVIMLASDQNANYYNTMLGNKDKLADYVSGGGVLVVGMYRGWMGYAPTQQFLPDGVIPNYEYSDDVDFLLSHYLVANPDRPVSNPNTTIDYMSSASSYYFTNLPADAIQVARDLHDHTVIAEYPYGSGTVLTVGIPMEWFYRHVLGIGGTGVNENNLRLLYNQIEYALTKSIPPCVEKSFAEFTLVETLLGQKAVLDGVVVSGDFNGTLDFSNFEIVSITTGPFAGKGFSKGEWEATLGGNSYTGDWKGALFLKPEEGKIYLKGATSGEMSATVDGHLTESVPGSGTYDQYQATWKIGRLGSTITSATINLNGTVSYQSSSEFLATELYVLQSNIEGTISGHYSGPLSTVLTHLRVTEETNPYWGEGFSIISYVSESGSGEAWTYDNLISAGRVRLKGLSDDPLFGIISATLDESELPRTLFLNIQRVDLGLPPMADLAVKTWGPTRVSPGQTISYVVEYRNDGLKAAEDIDIVMKLPYEVEFVSAIGGGSYTDASHEVIWYLGSVLPQSTGQLSVNVRVLWGLPWGTSFENIVSIPKEWIEVEVDPTATIDYDILEASDSHLVAIANISNQLDSGSVDVNITSVSVSQEIEPIFEYIEMGDEVEIRTGLTISSNPMWIFKTFKIAYEIFDKINKIFGTIHDVGMAKEWQERRDAYLHWLKENARISQIMYNDLSSESKPLFWEQANSRILSQTLGLGPEWTERMEKSVGYAPQGFHYKLGKAILEHEGRQFEENWYQDYWTRLDCGVAEMDAYKDFLSDPEISYDVGSHQNDVAVARDPNIKYGPEGHVQPGQTLDYEVEFENEGEGIAFGVYITDVLDGELDDLTISLGGEGTYNPSTRTITWFVGEVGPGEGGSFYFSVNVRGDAPVGTDIINFATVYFPSVPEITRTNAIVSIIPLPNLPPIADAGPDQTVEGTSPEGAQVTLDGTGSSDPDNDPLTFTWRENGNIIAGPTTDSTATVILAFGTHTIELTVDDGQGETDTDEVVINVVGPGYASLSGFARQDSTIGLLGVNADVYDSTGAVCQSVVTDDSGYYHIDSLPNGDYTVSIMTPLGYQADQETQQFTIYHFPVTVDFLLTQLEIVMAQRGRGYWMHQANALLSGEGDAQESYDDMCNYMDLIRTHFNEHQLNPVNIFSLDLNSDCPQRLEALRDVILPKPNSSMNDKAKAHLATLLLNTVSGKIAQWAYISEDSATVSQAITYCNTLIVDGYPENDESAKNIAEMINEGQMVPGGMIDLATADIAYRQETAQQIPSKFGLSQNYPNPFNAATEISFSLAAASHVKLEIFNVMGQRVAAIVNGFLEAGEHTVTWDGSNSASGVYVYRLEVGAFIETRKMLLLK